MAAINPHICRSHEAAGIADEKDCRASVLLRNTELSKHVLRRPVSFPLWVLLEESFNHGSNDVAWTQRVDADAVLAPFHGEVTG